MKIFDTHIHFNTPQLRSQFHISIQQNKGFFYNIVSTSLEDSFEALDKAKASDFTFCSIGIHPTSIYDADWSKIEQEFHRLLKSNKKILAIGEVGLDFYHLKKKDNLEIQTKWLIKQYELAKEYDLPMILHIRDAYPEIIYLLNNVIKWKGIIHCFSGTVKELNSILHLETWMISLSPIIYRDIDKFREIISITPIDRLVIESDAPWLTHNSLSIKKILDLIAEIKKQPLEDIADIIFKNSLKIFNLK